MYVYCIKIDNVYVFNKIQYVSKSIELEYFIYSAKYDILNNIERKIPIP